MAYQSTLSSPVHLTHPQHKCMYKHIHANHESGPECIDGIHVCTKHLQVGSIPKNGSTCKSSTVFRFWHLHRTSSFPLFHEEAYFPDYGHGTYKCAVCIHSAHIRCTCIRERGSAESGSRASELSLASPSLCIDVSPIYQYVVCTGLMYPGPAHP